MNTTIEIDRAIIETLKSAGGQMDFDELHASMRDRFNCDGAPVMMAIGRLIDEREIISVKTETDDENYNLRITRPVQPRHCI